MLRLGLRCLLVVLCLSVPVHAAELVGHGRFCGYAPIIDLLPDEKITTLEGGIHGGSFRWEGGFGSLEVIGIGWASRPKGRMIRPPGDKPARFAQKKVRGQYQVAIWNGRAGAAYFRSDKRFTPAQYAAIDRVSLYQEDEPPSQCTLKTVFSWQ